MDDPVSTVINVALLFLVLPFAIWFFFSWTFALALTPFVALGRILFRRPWPVVAFRAGGVWEYREYTQSWTEAGRLMKQARAEIDAYGQAYCLTGGIGQADSAGTAAPIGQVAPPGSYGVNSQQRPENWGS
ncbi:hypothetical protein [Actinomadura gamaensis]|uniref:Uncharacterized protein n=1 Tax=Actinomadura gamaensis TaxID=1763541 RepID=A0ABV9UAR7_9ACTN